VARSVIATDDFNAYGSSAVPSANWTDLDGVVAGQVWVIPAGGSVAQRYSSFSMLRRSAGTYSADQYAKAAVVGFSGSASSDAVGVALRCSADAAPNDDGYGFVLDDSDQSFKIIRRVNGTNTTLASTAATGFAAGHTIEGEATGTGASVDLTLLSQGVIKLTFSDTDGARITAAGRPGVIANKSAGTLSLDDWEGGDIVAGSSGSLLTRQRGLSGGMAELTGGMRG
jgi:hypothetical protein